MLKVKTKNSTPMYKDLCQPYSTLQYRNKTTNSYIVVCKAKCTNEIDDASSMNVCKKILVLALVFLHSVIIDETDTSSTILVMVPVDAGFWGQQNPVSRLA